MVQNCILNMSWPKDHQGLLIYSLDFLSNSKLVTYKNKSTVVKIIVQYQHNLDYCVYFNNKTIKYQLIIMSKDTEHPVVVRINKYVTAEVLLSLHSGNDDESNNIT